MPTPVSTSNLNFYKSDMLSLACMFRDTDWINIVISDNNINTLTSNLNYFVTVILNNIYQLKLLELENNFPNIYID